MKEFKEGDWVTNPDWGESKPFQLRDEHYKGISQKNEEWFGDLIKWIPKNNEWCIFWNGKDKRYFIIARFDYQDKHVFPYVTKSGIGRFMNIAPIQHTKNL